MNDSVTSLATVSPAFATTNSTVLVYPRPPSARSTTTKGLSRWRRSRAANRIWYPANAPAMTATEAVTTSALALTASAEVARINTGATLFPSPVWEAPGATGPLAPSRYLPFLGVCDRALAAAALSALDDFGVDRTLPAALAALLPV